MTFRQIPFIVLGLLAVSVLIAPTPSNAQQAQSTQKKLRLAARAAKDQDSQFHLLPAEEEQERGNAVPVLLRMTYEQQPFMKDVYPRLHEFAEMDVDSPKLHDLQFNRFARQIIRAGSMSDADWQYPLRSERPYMILLPDVQSQRQLVGRGMTAWIKQRLAKGEINEALIGIKAQLACGRHCAATPVVVCHLVGLAIANSAFDSLELAMQNKDCPNMYWSLAALGPTLQDLGPMVRWELWAMPTRLKEPLPPVGDIEWSRIAQRFIELYAEVSSERYTPEEGKRVAERGAQLAKQELSKSSDFSEAEIAKMSVEEHLMRWLHLQAGRFRAQVEPLTFQSPLRIIAAKQKIETANKTLLAETGAKSSPFPISLPLGILACRNFERRVKFLQTVEALRDYAGKHGGKFPAKLDELDLPAPNDPFTEKPFRYELNGASARLWQADIDGFVTSVLDYELSTK